MPFFCFVYLGSIHWHILLLAFCFHYVMSLSSTTCCVSSTRTAYQRFLLLRAQMLIKSTYVTHAILSTFYFLLIFHVEFFYTSYFFCSNGDTTYIAVTLWSTSFVCFIYFRLWLLSLSFVYIQQKIESNYHPCIELPEYYEILTTFCYFMKLCLVSNIWCWCTSLKYLLNVVMLN